jgi:tRNA 2-selenouridine synthase
MPLFSDEERATVGTAYKQVSREMAIRHGLRFFGPKMVSMIDTVEKLVHDAQKRNGGATPRVLVHCWRGGMRSAGVAWLLDLYGFDVATLVGGYKAYRGWALAQFAQSYPFRVLGGYTGSGKTAVLQHMATRGHTVIDLEGLASHKGSAFGNINMPPQPSQEMFENLLAMALHRAAGSPAIWIEDESARIGDLNLPRSLYEQKQHAPLYLLDVPFEQRLQYILQDYGRGQTEMLANAIIRIRKRLGPEQSKDAMHYLMDGNLRDCFAILLQYYDKWYGKSLGLKPEGAPKAVTIDLEDTEAGKNAEKVVSAAKLDEKR